MRQLLPFLTWNWFPTWRSLNFSPRKCHKDGSKGGHDLKNLIGKIYKRPMDPIPDTSFQRWRWISFHKWLMFDPMEKSVGCPYLRTRLLARQNRIWRHFSGHLDFYMFRFWGSWPKPFFWNYYWEGETTQHSQVGRFLLKDFEHWTRTSSESIIEFPLQVWFVGTKLPGSQQCIALSLHALIPLEEPKQDCFCWLVIVWNRKCIVSESLQ